VIPAFLVLAGVSMLVLTLACANAASLMLTRALARRDDLRTQRLGATTTDLRVRQFLLESLSLAVLAIAPALAIAVWSPPWLLRHAAGVQLALPFSPDSRTLLVTVALALLSAGCFGVAPALHLTRGRELAAARSRLSPQLVGLQVLCSLTLLVLSALFVVGVPDGWGAQRLATAMAVLVALFALLLASTSACGAVSYGAQLCAADGGVRREYGASMRRVSRLLGSWRRHTMLIGLCGGAAAAAASVVLLRHSLDLSAPSPRSRETIGLLALSALATLAMSLPLCRTRRVPGGAPPVFE
jgi:hypothetical protein